MQHSQFENGALAFGCNQCHCWEDIILSSWVLGIFPALKPMGRPPRKVCPVSEIYKDRPTQSLF